MKTILYADHHHAMSLCYVVVFIFLYRFQRARKRKENRVRHIHPEKRVNDKLKCMKKTINPSLADKPAYERKPASLQSSASIYATNRLHSHAVDIAVWGMPIVSVYAMREAFFRDAGARYGDIVYWSQPADWKVQLTTPNASSYYVYFNFNTKEGPVVLDFPAAEGAGLFGTLLDAWQIPLSDVGPEGEDKGKGGRYLIIPPVYNEKLPEGYIPLFLETYNGYALFRAIPASSSPADRDKAIDLIKKMRLYPLNNSKNPPAQKHIDLSGQLFDGVVHFDETFFYALSKMINEEPAETRDLIVLSQLLSIGIVKGKDFTPNAGTLEILKTALAEVHSSFMFETVKAVEPFWKGAHWGLHKTLDPETGFSLSTYEGEKCEVEARVPGYFMGFAPPKNLGGDTFDLAGTVDSTCSPLRGEKNYYLHVPPNVPARQYWEVTVYDAETNSFFKNSPVVSIDSFNTNVKRNGDGSVDIYFGASAPAGKENNWIYTAPRKGWWTYFRFYGPVEAVFNKTWSMDDIEEIS
jgi:hypothetical protein